MSRAVILSAVRTPVGRYGGALAGERPDDLAALVIGEAVSRAGVPPGEIEDVVMKIGSTFVPVKHEGVIYLRPPTN